MSHCLNSFPESGTFWLLKMLKLGTAGGWNTTNSPSFYCLSLYEFIPLGFSQPVWGQTEVDKEVVQGILLHCFPSDRIQSKCICQNCHLCHWAPGVQQLVFILPRRIFWPGFDRSVFGEWPLRIFLHKTRLFDPLGMPDLGTIFRRTNRPHGNLACYDEEGKAYKSSRQLRHQIRKFLRPQCLILVQLRNYARICANECSMVEN